jgi:hypothetical protein
MLVARRSLWLHRYPGSCADRAGISAFVDQPARCLRVLERALEISAAQTDPLTRARTRLSCFSGRSRRVAWKLQDTRDWVEILAQIRRFGDERPLACHLIHHSFILELWLDQGDLSQAYLQAERFLKGASATAQRTWQALAWKLSAPVALALNDPVAPSVEDDGRMRCPGGRVACSRYRGTILRYRLALRSSGSAGTFQCQAHAIRVRFEADRLNRALELAGDPCSMRCRGHCRARAFPRPSPPG